ncbi:MAG: IS3 family transposase [Chitinophagaceae bacterium]|nr:MAG: IS3 family transposase [Chitinophagaceae bacterium]
MKDIFALCRISRQAHFQALLRQRHWQQKTPLYIGMMEQIREIHPGMGLRTMYEMLQPPGIGRDSFMALGAAAGYQLQAQAPATRTTFSVKTNRYANLLCRMAFNGQDQVWSSDITYFHCLGQFFYLVFIMDVYTRRIVGYSVSDNLRAENNLLALRMALACRGVQDYGGGLIHHSDKGGQYAADAYTELLQRHGIRISMCREVYENTHIERVNGTIKNQYLRRWTIQSPKELHRRLSDAVDAYNTTKPHESLGKLPPVSYEQKLKTIPADKRKQLTIYTRNKHHEQNLTNQLNLFQQLS